MEAWQVGRRKSPLVSRLLRTRLVALVEGTMADYFGVAVLVFLVATIVFALWRIGR